MSGSGKASGKNAELNKLKRRNFSARIEGKKRREKERETSRNANPWTRMAVVER